MASPFTPATIPSAGFNGGTITAGLTIDPATDAVSALDIELPVAAVQSPLLIRDSNAAVVLGVDAPGRTGLTYAPDPNNSTRFRFLNDGNLSFKNSSGTEYLSYTTSNGILQLDPDNGQVYVKSGNLVTAGSEPADATLTFNGCVSLYVEGSSLKAKAKIGGDFVHATIGVFT